MPYLNAVAIALQRLAEKIVLLLGFEDFDWGGLGKSGGTTSDALSTIYDETENVSDAMGDATKKTKEFQNQLLGFDEAYKLSEPAEDTSSSATGAGLSGPDTAALDAAFKKIANEYQAAWTAAFEKMEQESTAIADRIISAFERGDYKGIGTYISTNISDALASINWDSVYQGARNFGTGLAEFMNGLITPDLFGNVGKTIAGTLNTKLYAVLSFGQTFDFTNLGESIAAGVNNFFATFDFGSLAETLNVWAKGILNTAITALDNIDWGMIGKQIGTFLADIDLFEIGFKVVQALWKGINAEFDLLVGAFEKAPLETIIVSFATMPKLLKAIMTSKFITGFKKLANGIKLVSGALIGNQTAITALSSQYPKLSKAINIAKDSFRALRTGISNGNVFNGVKLAIENLRNNLTGLQKGAITAVAGFAEFKVISNTFEGLISGNENLLEGIMKIGGVAAAAAAAMYTALGPAGLAIAAVIGAVGAVKGISDAFEEIRIKEFGEIIKNAMTNPGGVPLSEITSQFANAFSEAASGFDIIKEKSSEMDSVQKNVESTWTEIYKIQEAMDNGVLSVEEGKQKLSDLFSELATLTETKFSTMNTVIMSVYGEGGSFHNALDSIGADTETAIDTMISYGYQNSERAKEIAKELSGMNIDSDEYKSLVSELATLTGEMSKFEQATSDFAYDMNSLQGKISYEEIFPNGEFDADALKQYLGEASIALYDYEDTIEEAGKELKQYWEEIYNSSTATEEQKAIARANIEYIPQAIESMKSEAEEQILSFTDMLQYDFLTKLPTIVDNAANEWESKKPTEKFWASIWQGKDAQSTYIRESTHEFYEGMNTLSDSIEEKFGELGIKGAGWSKEAGEEILNGIFEFGYSEENVARLESNYEEIISDGLEKAKTNVRTTASEVGTSITDGTSDGILISSWKVSEATGKMINKAIEAAREKAQIHSPSKVFQEMGGYIVEGFSSGISNNINFSQSKVQQWIDNTRQIMSNSNLLSLSQQNGLNVVSGFNQGINGGASSTYDTINYYTERIKSGFSNISNSFYDIGESAMQGFSNGLSDKQQEIYNKAQTISKNLAKTIKSALSIHSPSKVMFELGDYTMQGFKNGLEHLYQPILSSVQGFSSDLQIAPAPDLKSIYRDYQYADMNYSMSYEGIEDYQSNYQNSNAETNALLRELLSAVREGKIIQVDGKQLGKTVQEQDKAHFAMTGKGMFIY